MRAPAGGAVLDIVPVLLGVPAFLIDSEPKQGSDQQAYQQIHGMKAGQKGLERRREAVQQMEQLLRSVRAFRQPPCFAQLGGVETDQDIGQIQGQLLFEPLRVHRSGPLSLVRCRRLSGVSSPSGSIIVSMGARVLRCFLANSAA